MSDDVVWGSITDLLRGVMFVALLAAVVLGTGLLLDWWVRAATRARSQLDRETVRRMDRWT